MRFSHESSEKAPFRTDFRLEAQREALLRQIFPWIIRERAFEEEKLKERPFSNRFPLERGSSRALLKQTFS